MRLTKFLMFTFMLTVLHSYCQMNPIVEKPLKLNCVYCFNKKVYIIADDGFILTSNDGKTWDTKNMLCCTGMSRMKMVSQKLGFLYSAGRWISRTTDGGLTWKEHGNISTNMNNEKWVEAGFADVDFINEKIGIAVDWKGWIYHTADGGDIWNVQRNNGIYCLTSINYLNGRTIYAFGTGVEDIGKYALIMKSVDRGINWTYSKLPHTSYMTGQNNVPMVKRSYFFNDSIGFLIDNNNYLYRTDDAGESWSRNQFDQKPELYDICFANRQNGFVVGSNGSIFRTTDGGLHWRKIESGVTVNLYSVACLNAVKAFIVGSDGTFLQSVDGGYTWKGTQWTARHKQMIYFEK